jgi:hypothetical protein
MTRWSLVAPVALLVACGGENPLSGWPAELVLRSPASQQGLSGAPVNDAPAVQLLDADGKPIAGAKVTFAPTFGGAVTGGVVTTDDNGVATVGAWIVGGGANALRASIPAPFRVPAVTFSATGVNAAYHIEVAYLVATTPAREAVFTAAAARWEQLIYGDVPDINANIPPDLCFAGQPAIGPVTDDLLIHVILDSIDGPDGALGAAGPCFIRTAGKLPLHGVMLFDTADVATLEADGQFDEVVLHEMGHVIGYGSLWPAPNLLSLLSGAGGSDPFFTGANARLTFDRIGGTAYTGGGKVPVENQGGPGTRDGHWRESVFGNELMTGFLNLGPNPLSVVTVASFRDEGYAVNYSAADAYTHSFSTALPGASAGERQGRAIALGNDILNLPIHLVDPSGRVVGLYRSPQ